MTDIDLTIPDFLRIDEETRRKAWESFIASRKPNRVEETVSPFAERYRKRKLRKLRREERELSTMIDQLRDRGDRAQVSKLYGIIKQVERDIARLTK